MSDQLQKFLLPACGIFLAVLMPNMAHADALLDKAHSEASSGDYASALKDISAVLKKIPKDEDARLLQAQIHGWQKQNDLAEKEFDALIKEDPKNTDALVARGYFYYGEGKLDQAAADFNAALAIAPTYTDARDGLALVEKARAEPKAADYKWQVDVGGEESEFARRAQTPWNNEFLQLTRFLGGGTAVHIMEQHYTEFEQNDMYTELGVDQTFTPYLNGYFYGGGTPDPGFRPRWHVATGGSARVNDAYPSVLWLTLDTRYDDYSTTEVGNINPGLRVEFADNWSLSGMMITVEQTADATKYGWQGRLDTEAVEGCRPYLGYSIAPETVNGVTVNTQSLFLGAAVDINRANTLNVGYTHDDREGSYIRHAVNATLSHRF